MKKLTRSKNDKILFGVCGGLAEYFNISSTVVRLAFIVLSLISLMVMLIAYVICAFIIPEENGFSEVNSYPKNQNYNSMKSLGIALVVIGLLLLAKILSYDFSYLFYNIKKLWPVLLVIVGIYLISQKDSVD